MRKLALLALVFGGLWVGGWVDLGIVGTGAVTLTPADGDAPVSVTVTETGRCGPTCVEGTAAVTNTGTRPLGAVTARVQVFAGATGDSQLWGETVRLGTLAPGDRVTLTRRASWTVGDVEAVRAAGGTVTALVTVESNRSTARFRARRQAG